MIGRLPEAVVYHYVRAATARPRVAYQSLDPATFEVQLDDLCRRRTPITWAALREALEGRRALPPDAVILTFDDGLADHHQHVLPGFVARGLQGVFMVLARTAGDGLAPGHKLHILGGALGPGEIRDAVAERLPSREAQLYVTLQNEIRAAGTTDPDDPWKRPLQRELEAPAGRILSSLIAERLGSETELARALYLDPLQTRDLVANGMAIGGHGRDHPWLDWVGQSRVRDEMAASASFLGAFAPGPWPFAYPYGAVPRGARSLLAGAGFAAAFTTRAGVRHDRYRIGRHDGDELGQDASALMSEATARRSQPVPSRRPADASPR